jgi:hypothetical protein
LSRTSPATRAARIQTSVTLAKSSRGKRSSPSNRLTAPLRRLLGTHMLPRRGDAFRPRGAERGPPDAQVHPDGRQRHCGCRVCRGKEAGGAWHPLLQEGGLQPRRVAPRPGPRTPGWRPGPNARLARLARRLDRRAAAAVLCPQKVRRVWCARGRQVCQGQDRAGYAHPRRQGAAARPPLRPCALRARALSARWSRATCPAGPLPASAAGA